MTAFTINTPIPNSGDDLVPMLFYVKAKDALRIQAEILRRLAEEPAEDMGVSVYKPPYPNTYGPKDPWELPAWTVEDRQAAAWIISVLGANQRRVVAQLVAGGSTGVWTSELRRRAGYDDSTSMAGVFKAIGGRFRSTGRRPVWNGGEKQAQKGQQLRVLDVTALHLFADVIVAGYPELAAEFGIA